jgi:hypothetical protein
MSTSSSTAAPKGRLRRQCDNDIMLVVIDESGDPGFSIGSSQYFVLGMLCFSTYALAEKASATVEEVRRIAGTKGEFKFSSSSDRLKEIFFGKIYDCEFEVRTVIVDKRAVRRKEVRSSPANFYLLCLRSLISETGGLPPSTTVKIDKCGDYRFRNACAQYVRKELVSGTIRSFKSVNSSSDNLVQLADMVTGAIARPYNSPHKNNAYRWYDLIQHKIARGEGEIVYR